MSVTKASNREQLGLLGGGVLLIVAWLGLLSASMQLGTIALAVLGVAMLAVGLFGRADDRIIPVIFLVLGGVTLVFAVMPGI